METAIPERQDKARRASPPTDGRGRVGDRPAAVDVLMVHSDELILVGARALLRDQEWVARCILATGPEQAVRIAEEQRPSVAVIRGCAPDGGAILAAQLRAKVPGIAVTPFGENQAREFVRAVRRAAAGEGDGTGFESVAPGLSVRELEVLQHLATGASNGEIGRRLFLSPHTVKQHVRRICGKLSARNRVEAIARAQALGALDGRQPPARVLQSNERIVLVDAPSRRRRPKAETGE